MLKIPTLTLPHLQSQLLPGQPVQPFLHSLKRASRPLLPPPRRKCGHLQQRGEIVKLGDVAHAGISRAWMSADTYWKTG